MKHCCLGKNPSPESFAKWCKKRGIFLHPDVAFLVPTKTMGCGVFAKKPLPAGTVVMECPASSSISPYVEPSAESPSIAILQKPEHEKLFKADPMLYVVLRLLAELCRTAAGTGSAMTAWRPWLEACPRMSEHFYGVRTVEELPALGLSCPSSPANSSEATRNSVASIGAHEAAEDLVSVNPMSWTTVAQQLAEMQTLSRWAAAQPFLEAYPSIWPAQHATFDLFCECMAQVSSRNFHREEVAGREGPYLLPGLDVINHSFDANCSFEMRGGGRKHATSFTVVTARAMRRGEQVYCSYGRIGLARFAVEFQFATPSVVQENMVRFSADTIAAIAATLVDRSRAGDGEGMAGVRTADLADMRRRVELLQRLGVLYDEGFYLMQPKGLPTTADMSPAEVSAVEERNERRAAEVKDSVRSLLVVVALLLCTASKEAFDDVYHHMTKEWLPSCLGEDDLDMGKLTNEEEHPPLNSAQGGRRAEEKALLKSMTLRFLAAKADAAAAQDSRVDDLFGPEKVDKAGKTAEQERATAAGRCRLLHTTLRAEQDVVKEYAKLVGRLL